MQNYLELLDHIRNDGEKRMDRTGVGTRSVFGHQLRFNLAESFPALTAKRLAWKSVVSELLFFLEGSSDERRLAEILYQTRDISKRTIWTDNADNQAKALGWTNTDSEKQLGPVYGVQWRSWSSNSKTFDQIKTVIDSIRENPASRRHIVSSWAVHDLDDMALPPCHVMFQFYVSGNGKLSCHMYQRSVDTFLGLPFNIASYALLTHIIALETGLGVGELIISMGDAHLYENHLDQVNELLGRDSAPPCPRLKLPTTPKGIDNYTMSDFELLDYNYHPTIKAEMAI